MSISSMKIKLLAEISTILWIVLLTVTTQADPRQITQSTQGHCSPSVADVEGDVTIVCEGVDPRVVERLNELLDLKQLQLDEMIIEANRWMERYRSLLRSLSASTASSIILSEINELISDGKFDQATEIVEEILEAENEIIEKLAQANVIRAILYELEYDNASALAHYRQAYLHRPEDNYFAWEYAHSLRANEYYQQSNEIFEQIVGRILGAETEPEESDLMILSSQVGMCQNLHDLEEYDDSIEICSEGLNSLIELQSSEHHDSYRLILLSQIAESYFSSSNFEEARRNAIRANEIPYKDDWHRYYYYLTSIRMVDVIHQSNKMIAFEENRSTIYDGIINLYWSLALNGKEKFLEDISVLVVGLYIYPTDQEYVEELEQQILYWERFLGEAYDEDSIVGATLLISIQFTKIDFLASIGRFDDALNTISQIDATIGRFRSDNAEAWDLVQAGAEMYESFMLFAVGQSERASEGLLNFLASLEENSDLQEENKFLVGIYTALSFAFLIDDSFSQAESHLNAAYRAIEELEDDVDSSVIEFLAAVSLFVAEMKIVYGHDDIAGCNLLDKARYQSGTTHMLGLVVQIYEDRCVGSLGNQNR